jgi:hypothetical protein
VVKEKEDWSKAITDYITKLMEEVKGVKPLTPQILQETALRSSIEALTAQFRTELKQEGIEVQEIKVQDAK